MKQYRQIQQTQDRNSVFSGFILTMLAHVAGFALCAHSDLTYLDPPPPENSFIIDFTEEIDEETPKPAEIGSQPQAEEIDRTKPVELIQKSESPVENVAKNVTPATKDNSHGDVEVPAPPVKEEPKLDPRASFPGMAKEDNTATTPHAADKATDAFKAGQPDGNSANARSSGTANAHLKGRKVMGTLPKPAYANQKEGIVVVQIKVDNYGKVIEAIAGADGTTVTDVTLWNAARKAAMETHFDQSASAPAVQVGTITYIFKLN